MARFIIRRLLVFPIVFVFANFLGFAYALLVKPIRAAENPYAAAVSNIQPLFPSYREYAQNLLRLDFGKMPNGSETILSYIGRAMWASAGLLFLALLLSIVIGIYLGARGARTNPPKIAGWLSVLTTLGLASPSFFLGILFITFSILYLIWGPGNAPLLPFQGYGWDVHLVLPALALMVYPMVKIAQITSGMMVGELGKQYVTASRSFGHTWRTIRMRYVMRNILPTVILTISGSLRLLVAELIIIERLFSWPGLGRLTSQVLVTSSSQSPMYLYPPLLAALFSGLALLFLVTDFIASILVRAIDPRLRAA